VGYLSYDFNDHPTTHLVEGLFVHHARHLAEAKELAATRLRSDLSLGTSSPQWGQRKGSRAAVEAIAVSFGKDDNSEYRANVVRHSASFVDVAEAGHVEAALKVTSVECALTIASECKLKKEEMLLFGLFMMNNNALTFFIRFSPPFFSHNLEIL